METAKEIPQEIKAKMFALYWGQDVVKSGRAEDDRTYNVQGANIEDIFSNGESVLDKSYLELKPLSQITDEDAIELGGILNVNDPTTEDYLPWIKLVLNKLIEGRFADINIKFADFFRSKGYALPYLNYSVGELVEAGVFKIKEVGND